MPAVLLDTTTPAPKAKKPRRSGRKAVAAVVELVKPPTCAQCHATLAWQDSAYYQHSYVLDPQTGTTTWTRRPTDEPSTRLCKRCRQQQAQQMARGAFMPTALYQYQRFRAAHPELDPAQARNAFIEQEQNKQAPRTYGPYRPRQGAHRVVAPEYAVRRALASVDDLLALPAHLLPPRHQHRPAPAPVGRAARRRAA